MAVAFDRPAAPALLDRLFNPRSIAVMGVKGGEFDPAARNSMARRFTENLVRHGFPGAIYPINPRYQTVGALPCYPNLMAAPGTIDAAVLIVPKDIVGAVLADCGAKGVKLVTVITSGYAEAGVQGRARHRGGGGVSGCAVRPGVAGRDGRRAGRGDARYRAAPGAA